MSLSVALMQAEVVVGSASHCPSWPAGRCQNEHLISILGNFVIFKQITITFSGSKHLIHFRFSIREKFFTAYE